MTEDNNDDIENEPVEILDDEQEDQPNPNESMEIGEEAPTVSTTVDLAPARSVPPPLEMIAGLSRPRSIPARIPTTPGATYLCAHDIPLYSIYMQSNYMQFLRKITKSCHPKIFQLYAVFLINFYSDRKIA